jgi:hypothetical protein
MVLALAGDSTTTSGRDIAGTVRNIGADVGGGRLGGRPGAPGRVSGDGERIEHVDRTRPRRSSGGPRSRASRFEAHTIAANIDVVFLVHALGSPPNQRRLERELVLAFDSGADPVVVLTKADSVADPEPVRAALADVALGVPVLVVERAHRAGHRRDRRVRADGDTLRSSVPAAWASRRS